MKLNERIKYSTYFGLICLSIFCLWHLDELILAAKVKKMQPIKNTYIYFKKGNKFYDVIFFENKKEAAEYGKQLENPVNLNSVGFELYRNKSSYLLEIDSVLNVSLVKVITANQIKYGYVPSIQLSDSMPPVIK